MIVLLDSNIVLDVMLPNPELFEESNAVMELAVKGFDFYISASAVTDIYYIAKKSCHSSEATKETIKNLLRIVSVAGVDETCILNALDSNWKDFEDSVQHQVAQQIKAEIIVTRNTNDYAASSIRVMPPKEFLSLANELL